MDFTDAEEAKLDLVRRSDKEQKGRGMQECSAGVPHSGSSGFCPQKHFIREFDPGSG